MNQFIADFVILKISPINGLFSLSFFILFFKNKLFYKLNVCHRRHQGGLAHFNCLHLNWVLPPNNEFNFKMFKKNGEALL